MTEQPDSLAALLSSPEREHTLAIMAAILYGSGREISYLQDAIRILREVTMLSHAANE